ncbi:MAG TPA: helix-hairpin-helix domain-containing protein, partial [Luteibaculaceae bacterium]|nr:helix-hairpin-helix domain-containing protein [Luteibaculaceae bacterium]
SDELGVSDHQAALQGACDILSEQFSEDLQLRSVVRQQFNRSGMLISKVARGKKDQAEKYRDYLDWSEPLTKAPSHRILAIFRGENEGLLSVKLEPNPEEVMEMLARRVIKGRNRCADYVTQALEDSYKRLLQPSIETEFRQGLKERADREAVRVFAENVKQLLLESPLGQKNVLAIDPGFRTGCKVVCLNRQGDLLHNETIYPHSGHREALEAENKIEHKIQAYKIEAIAIGNGTAGRETEAFVKKIRAARDLPIIMVNESGASVYSASAVAREEFPDYDVTVRGAVSIGRRLMDPLAELVKIDPKSIGVGQYQHDVNQAMLQDALQQVVSSAVNAVGVEVNTASKQLLSCVSGLGPALAENIVRHRKENGPFKSRKELKKVPRMGEKTFEQCAGFLRIREAEYPLDRSAVHPESYTIVEKMAKDLGCSLAELVSNKALQKQIDLNKYTSATVGLPTLKDILDELDKPGRDPRAQFQMVQFAGGINDMQQLAVGMVLTGIVTNITSFGCFVDVGVHQDGLVHISELANRFVKDPNEVVKLRQAVQVKVIDLDLARKRIQLSIKQV